MTEIAARWRDEVLPHVAWRQWVLTVPFGLRQRMAWDREWLDVVLGEFHRVIQNRFRLLGRKQGVKAGEYAAVTAVQRFGGALQVHVHFHLLVAEGIWDGPPGISSAAGSCRDWAWGNAGWPLPRASSCDWGPSTGIPRRDPDFGKSAFEMITQ